MNPIQQQNYLIAQDILQKCERANAMLLVTVAVKETGEQLMVFENSQQTKQQIITALEGAIKVLKGEGKTNAGLILPFA